MPSNPCVAAALIAAGLALPVATTTSTPDAIARRKASATRGVMTLFSFNSVPSKSVTSTLLCVVSVVEEESDVDSPDARLVSPVTFHPSAFKTSCSAAAITSASLSLTS